jgi:hypothetical protein
MLHKNAVIERIYLFAAQHADFEDLSLLYPVDTMDVTHCMTSGYIQYACFRASGQQLPAPHA